MIELVKVETKKQAKTFVKFPHTLYKNNPYWVPALTSDEINSFVPEKNPSSEYCEYVRYLAYKDGKLAGRIAGIINNKCNETWNERRVRFSRFDFIDDTEVSGALLNKIEEWGREKGLEILHGPLGFSGLDQEGMLVEGYEELSTFVTLYNYPYYMEHMEKHGYIKDTDWIEYQIKVPEEPVPFLEKLTERIEKKGEYRLIEFTKRKDVLKYAHDIFALINKAYAPLYGAIELDQKTIDNVIDQFIGLLNPEFVKVVLDKSNEVVAFGITFPSLSKAAKKANGNLFPFGFIHILRALKKNDRLDLYLVGVRPDLQGKGINALLINSILKTARKYNMKFAESNPELELNKKVQSQWKFFETRQHRRRRIYAKALKEGVTIIPWKG